MKLIGNYKDDVKDLIKGSDEYVIPSDISDGKYKVKLSIFQAGIFQENHILEINKDYYIKNNEIYLRPNELLDREDYFEGNYTLQFDFIQRYEEEELYLAEISPSRKEIRLFNQPKIKGRRISRFLNELSDTYTNTELTADNYKFNGFLELIDSLIPINAYVLDKVTYPPHTNSNGGEENSTSIILKLNTALPSNIQALDKSLKIVTKFLESQTEDIYFVDKEQIASGAQRGLPVDMGFIKEKNAIDPEDEFKNYSNISSGSLDIISDLNNNKKDINLNIDFSKFDNHVFFGSAKTKLENFKDKVVKLEGIYAELSSSLAIVSSADNVDYRKNLFKKIRDVKESFTAYERFMYNDNQQTTINSAPGLGTNLAGNNFKNTYVSPDTNIYTIISGSNAEGFEKLHNKSGSTDFVHLFTDNFNVEQPPFFNTNDFVYLSFVLRASGSDEKPPQMSGSAANSSAGIFKYATSYEYRRDNFIPGNAHESSNLMNPVPTASNYQRYIFKAKQNYYRPFKTDDPNSTDLGVNLHSDSGFTEYFHNHELNKFEILSGSNVRKASTSGSIGDDFAYGIRDSSGQKTQQIFPNVVDRNNLSNTFKFITGSFLPEGDLFPVYLHHPNTNDASANFTDVRVSYKDPSNTHPFSSIYRPPSGSYAGSDEWNNWYTNALATASLHDQNNVHSLVNNLPLSLRRNDDHAVLRNFVHMLGEQFDLLRNYIDNYHNFYRLGYTNPNSMPDNLLPILGDTVGWELLNTIGGSSIEDYATSTAGDEVGVQNVINSTWKKILNNLIYVYKVKGTTESINSLLNLYGFDSSGFKMREYGGSTAEHNPTIITNDSQDFLEGITNVQGNVSYVEDIQPFPMMNFRGTNSLGIDWWRNDAETNGIEFVFNADRSLVSQTILRSSGSSNDLWDLRLIPSASSTDFSQLQFRLNASNSGSGVLASSAISMSSPFVDFQDGNIYNVFLQRNSVTGSSPHNQLTQSYHLLVSRKDDDKIRNVSHISMSSDQLTVPSASRANYNFVNQHQSKIDNNLFVGESLSGSLSELRTWNAYVSMSKFKQHTLNYQSIVGNHISSSVVDLTYRYKFDENIVNWSTNPNSASLTLHDANSTFGNDYSILIASQDNFNYLTTMTEQTFYRLSVQGTDSLPNDNQTNLFPGMTIAGELSPDADVISDPTDNSGQSERQYTNKFGRGMSYVNAIDSFVVNQLPDFRIDDFIGDPDEDDTETYQDLLGLRKSLIGDTRVSMDVEANLRVAEDLLTEEVSDTIETMTPARTNFEMFYDIKNDTLFRSKLGRNTKIQTKLNPNKVTGVIDADKFDEPTITSFANNNFKEGTIDADSSDEPTVTSFVNNNVKEGTIDADQWDEPTINSFANDKVKIGNIDADQWDEPTLNASYESFTGNTKINYVNLTNSKRTPVYNVTPKVGSHDMNQAFLGPKNHIGKNQGVGVNDRFFKSINPGTDGNYNTYKFENRFTFKTIGDTEKFINSQSHHDVFNSFQNRYFVDKNDVNDYKYKSFFGVGADSNGAPKDGRMVGRTRFFKTDSDGNITYPSNHFINARTSKDALYKLIYKGTQYSGANPTTDPIDRDPNPKIAAYIIRVGGADTVQRIKVERPVSIDKRTITIFANGNTGNFTFELFKRSTSLGSVILNPRNEPNPEKGGITFGITGNLRDYNYKITPETTGHTIRNANTIMEVVNGRPARAKGSITKRRQIDGSMVGTFTRIDGDFSIRVRLKN